MDIKNLDQTKADISRQMQHDKETVETYAVNIAQVLFNLQGQQRIHFVYKEYLLNQLTPQRPDLFFVAFIANYDIYFNMVQNIFNDKCIKADSNGNPWEKGKSMSDFPSEIIIN